MRKRIIAFFLLVGILSCQNSGSKDTTSNNIDRENKEPIVFADSSLNNELLDYLEYSRNAFSGDKIHTVTFDTLNKVRFSGRLCIVRNDLIGHIHYNDDIILFYDKTKTENSSYYLNNEILETDSILDFPYFEDIENLPPFDPPNIEFDLTTFDHKGQEY